MVAIAYQPEQHATIRDYWAIECDSEIKHEYVNGLIVAIAGASANHATIVTNINGSLYVQLRGRSCQPWSNDMRIKVAATSLRAYPDIVVAHPPLEWDDELPNTLCNPVVIIEVLSPSTEAFDRGAKFAHYRRLESLTDYLLVAQDERRIEHHQRQPDGEWLSNIIQDSGETLLETIECRLSLDDVYERVEWPEDKMD